jgi:predicted transcriptional regulator
MPKPSQRPEDELTRRERQIMDVIYMRGRATAAEVRREIPDPPSYSAVRALLRLLEEKGHLTHEQDGPRYVFSPTTPRRKAGVTALERLVVTFFDGSAERLVSTLLDSTSVEVSDDELERIARLIEQARREES